MLLDRKREAACETLIFYCHNNMLKIFHDETPPPAKCVTNAVLYFLIKFTHYKDPRAIQDRRLLSDIVVGEEKEMYVM